MSYFETKSDRAAILDFGKPFPSLMLPIADGTFEKNDRFHFLHMFFTKVIAERKLWGRIQKEDEDIMDIIRAIAPEAFRRLK